jgi:hypothetical protein
VLIFFTVAKMAGHASLITTARYDRCSEDSKRKEANLLHIPFVRREETLTISEKRRSKYINHFLPIPKIKYSCKI